MSKEISEKKRQINKRKHKHLKFYLSLKLLRYHLNAHIIDVTKSQQKYLELLTNVDLWRCRTIVKICYTVEKYLNKNSLGNSATSSNYILYPDKKEYQHFYIASN